MRCLRIHNIILDGLCKYCPTLNSVNKVDFERLFYGDIIKPQNLYQTNRNGLIGNFSGAILENEKNEQFFVVQGDEINIENQIFYIEEYFPR